MIRRMALLLAAAFLLDGCGASVSIPSEQESRARIAALQPVLDSLDRSLSSITQSLPRGHDLISRTRFSAVNLLLAGVTNRSLKDIHIEFLPTRPLWKEERSILGIRTVNSVDIDTGTMDIDLKTFAFTSIENNRINAHIEIEGTGKIKASGTYTGVSASVSPQIHFYVNEQVQFSVAPADSDYIMLRPIPGTVMLKTRVSVSLLGWNVPYYTEIPLQTADLIKPVLIPSAVQSQVVFPIPAASYGEKKLEFVRRLLRFSRSTVRAHDNVLEYRSDIEFVKE